MPAGKKLDREKVLAVANEFEAMARRRGEELVSAAARKYLQLATGRRRIEKKRAELRRQLEDLERKAGR